MTRTRTQNKQNKPIGDERNMNKVIASLLMIGVVAAMAGAGTFAYFTDTETTQGTFTAGTLDLVVDGMNGVKTNFEIENVQPSYNESCEVNLTNIGTCDGYLSIWMENLTDDDNGCTVPEAAVPDNSCGPNGGGELSQNLYIVIQDETVSPVHVYYDDTLANFAATHSNQSTQLDLGDLDAGESRDITFGYYVPSNVGNIIQSDSSTFDVVVDLLQIEMPKPYP